MSEINLEKQMAVINNKLDNLVKGFDEFKKDIKSFRKEVRDDFEGLDNKYASKNVEKLVYGAVGIILTTVLGAILALVIHFATT